MPLFVVRPSRGAWVFFGLVALGVVGARAADRREARVVRQDRPASVTAQELATCLLGSNAGWVLRDPGERDALLRWTFDAGRVLRGAVTAPPGPTWLQRCAETAGRLHGALRRASTSPLGLRLLTQDVNDLLARAAADRDERFALIDGDQLPAKFAALMMQVHALSPGTRANWSPAPNDPSAPQVEMPRLPRLRPLPTGLEDATLGEPGTLVGRNAGDGMLHALEVDATGLRDLPLGTASPLPGPARGGLLRVWRDEGPALVGIGAVPRILRMPQGFRIEGPASEFQWDAATASDARALLSLDGGTLRVHAAPLEGPVTWSAATPVGPGESILGALITPDHEGPAARRWRVTLVRPRLDDAVVEQRVVSANDPVVDPASTRPAALGLSVGEAETVIGTDELPASIHRVETCQVPGAAYMVLSTAEGIITLRLAGRTARASRLPRALQRGTRFEVRCDEQRALVTEVPTSRQHGGGLFEFPAVGAARATQLEAPPGGVSVVHATVLVRDGVLAVVSTPGTVRTWLHPWGARWQPAGLVAHLIATPRTRRAITRLEASARDRTVTLLVHLAEAPRVLVQANPDQALSPYEEQPARAWSPAGATVLVSNDGGAHFAAP